MCCPSTPRGRQNDAVPCKSRRTALDVYTEPEQMTRDEQVHLRVRADELALMRATAQRAGRSLSDLVRDLVTAERDRLQRLDARVKR